MFFFNICYYFLLKNVYSFIFIFKKTIFKYLFIKQFNFTFFQEYYGLLKHRKFVGTFPLSKISLTRQSLRSFAQKKLPKSTQLQQHYTNSTQISLLRVLKYIMKSDSHNY